MDSLILFIILIVLIVLIFLILKSIYNHWTGGGKKILGINISPSEITDLPEYKSQESKIQQVNTNITTISPNIAPIQFRADINLNIDTLKEDVEKLNKSFTAFDEFITTGFYNRDYYNITNPNLQLYSKYKIDFVLSHRQSIFNIDFKNLVDLFEAKTKIDEFRDALRNLNNTCFIPFFLNFLQYTIDKSYFHILYSGYNRRHLFAYSSIYRNFYGNVFRPFIEKLKEKVKEQASNENLLAEIIKMDNYFTNYNENLRILLDTVYKTDYQNYINEPGTKARNEIWLPFNGKITITYK